MKIDARQGSLFVAHAFQSIVKGVNIQNFVTSNALIIIAFITVILAITSIPAQAEFYTKQLRDI